MQIVREIPELQALADAERAAGRRIGLVPTMGALHAGHLALVVEARRRADFVCVSIFVNPSQFGPSEDLGAYPRGFERDADQCRAHGVDVLFAPDEGWDTADGPSLGMEAALSFAESMSRSRMTSRSIAMLSMSRCASWRMAPPGVS